MFAITTTPSNPTESEAQSTSGATTPTVPSGTVDFETIDRLLTRPDGDDTLGGLRDRALLELIYGSGARAGEVRWLNTRDVNLKEEVVRIRTGPRPRDIPIGMFALKAIKAYLDARRSEGWEGFRDPVGKPLFFNTHKKRMKERDIRRCVSKYSRELGITPPITPQVIRHSHADHLLKRGAPAAVVCELLGVERLPKKLRP